MNIRPVAQSPSFKANLLFEQVIKGIDYKGRETTVKKSIELDPRKIISLQEDCYDPYGYYTNPKRETTITDDNNTKYKIKQSLKDVKELIKEAKQSPDEAEPVPVHTLIEIV